MRPRIVRGGAGWLLSLLVLAIQACLLVILLLANVSTLAAMEDNTCSSPNPPVCDDVEAIERLLRYALTLYSRGDSAALFSENVHVFCHEKKGRGLRLEGTNLKKGEVFLRLPLSALLTSQSFTNDNIEPINHLDALAMVIIEQDYSQNPYVATLPMNTGVNTGFRMCEEDLASKVKDLDLQEEARDMKDMVEDRGLELQSLGFIHDPKKYEKAVSIIQSRVFVVNALKDGDWVRIPAMVMIADMMNLALPSKANSDCATNEESTHFECFATRDIVDGEELLTIFVKKGDHDLDSFTWSYYGFAFSDDEKQS